MPYTFKKYLRSSSRSLVVVNRCTVEHNEWRDPISGSRIKTLKMLGAVGGLLLVLFYLYCDLENQIWVAKRCLFSKEVKIEV